VSRNIYTFKYIHTHKPAATAAARSAAATLSAASRADPLNGLKALPLVAKILKISCPQNLLYITTLELTFEISNLEPPRIDPLLNVCVMYINMSKDTLSKVP